MTTQTGTTKNDTLIFASTDTAIDGLAGTDTLLFNQTNANVSSASLTSIEILKGGAAATTFTVDMADLASKGSVIGGISADTLVVKDTDINLTSTTLTGIETLQAGLSLATTFTVDALDLFKGGSVLGSTGADTLIVKNAAFNLTSTVLTSVEKLQAGVSTATTFTVDKADLANGGSVIGSSANDTLTVKGTAFDLTGTSLTSVEILKAGAGGATFSVDQGDLVVGGSVIGSSGIETLIVIGTGFDLRSTTLSSVEILKSGAAGTASTTFLLDQADLKSGGAVIGSTNAADTVAAADSALNLTSTTLTGVEFIVANTTNNTTFTVTAQQAIDADFKGSSGDDTLIVKSGAFDLTSTGLTSVELLKAGLTTATTFTVDQGDLATGGSIIGTKGADILVVKGTSFNLSSTALSSVEKLQAGSNLATTFTLDQNDLASKGSVLGSTLTGDTILAGSSLNLTSTTLTGIENLKAGTTSDTTMTVNLAQFNTLAISGSAGKDTLALTNASYDLTGTVGLTSIENLGAGLSTATTFKVDLADLVSGGSVTGNKGVDTLIVTGANVNLSSTTLISVEKLQAQPTNSTTFTLDNNDLAAGGSIIGSTSALDTVVAAGTQLDLTGTTLTGIELLKTGTTFGTTFTVDQADLKFADVQGGAGKDTLIIKGQSFDLTSEVLASIEILKAGSSLATTFKIDQADLASGGTVAGNGGNDTLSIKGPSLDLTDTTLSSVEILRAGTSVATTFTVNQADLIVGGSVIGSSGKDILETVDTELDLSSTALTSIETLHAGGLLATTFTVDQADLASGGAVIGVTGEDDSLVAAGTTLNLASSTVTDVEILKAGTAAATTFTVDQADLADGGSVEGSTATDTLTINGTSLDLTTTALSSVEVLKAGKSVATLFTVDQDDLLPGGTVQGSTGVDTLAINGTLLDLSSTTLVSVEILKAAVSGDTTFQIDQIDLASGGSVQGHTDGVDTLTTNGSVLDLTSTTLSSVEILTASLSSGTDFIVNQVDLASGGSVVGDIAGTDALVIHGNSLDLTGTSLDSVDILRAGLSTATTFTVDADDLADGGTVQGSSGIDTLVINGSTLDLTSTTLDSVEVVTAGLTSSTTFVVDQDDLTSPITFKGSSDGDRLVVDSNIIDLTSTTLISVETIETSNQSLATIFTVGNGEGGSTVALSANGESDTIEFSNVYKVSDITSDDTILAHTLSISDFEDGVGGDVIDISGVTNGVPTSSYDISGYIDLAAPTTLKQALNLAAAADGSSESSVVSFQFGDDTYILVDKSASTTLTVNDAVIRLVGAHDLDAANVTF